MPHERGHELPDDASFEILTRVAVESLPACRRVCQSWRRITYEPTFSALHCRRTRSVSGYFIQELKQNRYSSCFVSPHSFETRPSLDFLPEPVKIEAASSTRGLLFCSGQEYRAPRHYVCRPAARQWWAMPNPRTRYPTLRTGVVVAPTCRRLDFKVVRFSEPRKDLDYMRCEVFDSRGWAWRRCKDVKVPGSTLTYEAGVSSNGALHWLTCDIGDIFSFDVEKETWKRIPPPPELSMVLEGLQMWPPRRLVSSEGKLCLLWVKGDSMVIWRLSYSQEKWEKVRVTTLNSIKKEVGWCIINDLPAPEVAFMETACRLVWYDLKSGKSTQINNCYHIREVFRFESDTTLRNGQPEGLTRDQAIVLFTIIYISVWASQIYN